MVETVFRNARVTPEGPLADLAVGEGKFLRVAPAAPAPPGPGEVDLEGRVVLPGFIESHIHLDKAFLEERRPNLSGTLPDAIAITLELKRAVTQADIRGRAERALRLLLRHGTTRARVQVEVDPIVRLRGMEAALELKEAYRGTFDLQLVVFPQEGIERQPGTEDLMREAMRMGGDAVGGVPYNDLDAERHLDIVFRMAGAFGKGVDLHLDFSDSPGDRRIESVVRRTRAAGLQGKVAVGHLTSLGSMDDATGARIVELIAGAGIHVLPLPATDLFLCGRGPAPPRHRSLTRVKELLRAGVNVSIASNNIRNAFTPSGRGDLLEIGLLLACVAHMSGASERVLIPPMFTVNAAKVLGVEDRYGLAPGKDADFVVLDTFSYNDIVIDQPEKRYVVKGGRVVVENLRETRWAGEYGSSAGVRP
ncbi:MAG: amidohydrolase family protein [Nitrospinota bacterium]